MNNSNITSLEKIDPYWKLHKSTPRVSSGTVNSKFEFLDAQNLTFLHPLSYTLYANYCSLKNSTVWSV